MKNDQLQKSSKMLFSLVVHFGVWMIVCNGAFFQEQLNLTIEKDVILNCSLSLMCSGNTLNAPWYLRKGSNLDVLISNKAIDHGYSQEDFRVNFTDNHFTVEFITLTEQYVDTYICVHGKQWSETLDLSLSIMTNKKSCSQPYDDGKKQEPLQTIIILVTVCIIIFITVTVCICYACKNSCKNSYSPVLPRVNSS
ncbi:uncharacterized protein [Mytilus edulis]|uniref:uncharacterized protein n=1 Tax=Mytilus edulis TaxID=6550 RepID=UPI0039F10D68